MSYSPSKLGKKKLCAKFDYKQDDDNPNSAASQGTDMHEAYATGNMSGLSLDQAQDIEVARTMMESECAKLAQPVRRFQELQVEYTPLKLKGTADDVALGADGHGIVGDLKTGPAGVPDDADDSAQGYSYVLGVYEKFPEVQSLDVFLFNPVTRDISERILTTRGDIPGIAEKLKAIIDRCEDPWTPPTAGSHCKECAHIAGCPAIKPQVMETAMALWPMTPAMLNPTAPDLTEIERSARAVIRQILEAWCEAVKTVDNASGVTPIGFKRIDKANPPKLEKENRCECVKRLLGLGLSTDLVYGCLRPTLGDVVEAARMNLGLSKEEAKTLVHESIQDLTTSTRCTYLMRDKKSLSDADIAMMLNQAKGGTPALNPGT